MNKLIFVFLTLLLFSGCKDNNKARTPSKQTTNEVKPNTMKDRINEYVPVQLTTDLTKLSEDEKKMIPLLIQAADIMNGLFWYQAYGNKNE